MKERMEDARSKKVIFVSSCLLNTNNKVMGLARYPGMCKEVFDTLHKYDLGIMQMQCPETLYLGVQCWWATKNLYRHVEEYLAKTNQTQLQGIDISKIQSEFNVSFEALVNRLSAINLITPKEARSLLEEKAEKTARSLFKAVGGNEALLNPSEVKYIPTEFLKMIIRNYQNKLVPFDSAKKIFDAFEIPLINGEHVDFDPIQSGEKKRSRRGIKDEFNTGY